MSKHLQRDLDQLEHDLVAMADLVQAAIYMAIRALQDCDTSLARDVIVGDPPIDAEENHIHEECLKMLALHQPVAVDLRRIASAMMITTDLERMGDLAEKMAKRGIELAGLPKLPASDKLQRMTDLTTTMVRQSLEAFVRLNAGLAVTVIRMDDEVDKYTREISDEIVDAMKTAPTLVDAGMAMSAVVRHLERIADHATSIAEDVVYLVNGEIVRHRPTPMPGDRGGD